MIKLIRFLILYLTNKDLLNHTGSSCCCSEIELSELVKEVKGQLKKIAITSSNRKDKVFLDIDMDRQGFISKANLHEMCLKQHLPADVQIIDKVSASSSTCRRTSRSSTGSVSRTLLHKAPVSSTDDL